MCLIIASPSGALPDQKLLDNAFVDNPDGWGFMTARNGHIEVRQGFHKSSLARAVLTIKDKPAPYVIHYRWATHGLKNIQNCHPFKITKNLYMAHNGIIKIDQPNVKMSDTWHFAEWLKRNRIEADDMHDKIIRDEIAHQIGNYNKLAFLDSNGNISLINEGAGKWETADIWLSNDHSCDDGYKKYFRGGYLYSMDGDDSWGEYVDYMRGTYKVEPAYANNPQRKFLGPEDPRACQCCDKEEWDQMVNGIKTCSNCRSEIAEEAGYAKPQKLLSVMNEVTACEYCGQEEAVESDADGFNLCQACFDWCNKVDFDYLEREEATDSILAAAADSSLVRRDSVRAQEDWWEEA